jgi:hypothetical protein
VTKRSLGLFGVVAGLGLLAVSPSARGQRVDASKLPVAEVGRIPEDKPEDVGANGKVDGIVPALPPQNAGMFGNVKGSHYVSLFATHAEADAHRSGTLAHMFRAAAAAIEGAEGGVEPGPPCFVVAQEYHMQAAERRWPISFETRPSVHGVEKGSPAARQFPNVGVVAVRTEKLTVTGGTAALAVREAWLDPGTLGVSEIRASTMSLLPVAEGPGHVTVYAARSATGAEVHFVVGLPRHRGRAARHIGHHARLSLGDQSGHSDCGHARMSLAAQPALGQHAMLTVDVIVREPAKQEGGAPAGERPMRELAMRTLEVHLGLSQTTSDEAPIPTVSFGWQGREKTQPVY